MRVRNSGGPPMTNIRAAAKTIAAGRRNRTPLPPLGDAAPQTEAEGYRIQDAVHDLLAADLGAMVGYKIGCTSPVMQQYLDIPHPCGGGVFAKGVFDSGASLSTKDFVRVGVECEIAVKLARDLALTEEPFTAEWVAEAIEAYLPAIEIVDDRYADWQTLGAPTLVADDFFAAGCVLGHPHNALAWLANHLAAEGRSLRAGQIVLTGSLVKTVWLNAGDKVVMELSGLGKVSVAFA